MTQLISLPNGQHLVVRDEPREGFTVPQGVLLGKFDSAEDARQFMLSLADAKR